MPILARFRRDNKGMALVEFAFMAPILILMYLGGFQLMDAIATNRKVTTTTRSIADQASQFQTITGTQADTILASVEQTMSPYGTSQGSYRISHITVQANGSGRVDWSRANNVVPLPVNSAFTVPVGLRQPGLSLIVADVTYNYTPYIAPNLLKAIPMRDQIYMLPRGSSSITMI